MRSVRLRELCDVLTLELGDSIHVVDKLYVAGTLSNVSARKHPLLSGDHDFHRKWRDLAKESRVVYKAWYISGYKAVHHAAYTDDFTGKDPCVDSGLRVIPHHATEELHTRSRLSVGILHVDSPIGVFQVAIASTCT